MMTKAIVTGGAGFLGHHLVQYLLEKTDWEIAIIDKLSYAARGLDRLREIGAFNNDRILILVLDFVHGFSEGIIREIGGAQYLFHLGAESHVDNSVVDPMTFVMSNVVGTAQVLELARNLGQLRQFIYFSTDEVFGPAIEGENFAPYDRYNARNPYSATKAGGEELAMAYAATYDLPVLVVHANNVFGIRQHPEKFIPLVTKRVLEGQLVKIHTDRSGKIIGSRFYSYAKDVCDAMMFLVSQGPFRRDKFNIPSKIELNNLEIALKIAEILDRPLNYELDGFRLGKLEHDLRYSTNGSTLVELGWRHTHDFDRALEDTVLWSAEHHHWLED